MITRAKLRVHRDEPTFVAMKDDLMKGMSYGFVMMNHPFIATKVGGSQGQSYGFAVMNLNLSRRRML